jgi:hypothetical protein
MPKNSGAKSTYVINKLTVIHIHKIGTLGRFNINGGTTYGRKCTDRRVNATWYDCRGAGMMRKMIVDCHFRVVVNRSSMITCKAMKI